MLYLISQLTFLPFFIYLCLLVNFYTQLFLKTNEGLDILQMCICDFLRLSADISLNPLTIFAESSILDAWLGF